MTGLRWVARALLKRRALVCIHWRCCSSRDDNPPDDSLARPQSSPETLRGQRSGHCKLIPTRGAGLQPDAVGLLLSRLSGGPKKDILTDLVFKMFACKSLHCQPTAHSRNTQRRVSHDDTRIDLDHLDPSAGSGPSRRCNRHFNAMAARARDEPVS
jgi:hypothetical protein